MLSWSFIDDWRKCGKNKLEILLLVTNQVQYGYSRWNILKFCMLEAHRRWVKFRNQDEIINYRMRMLELLSERWIYFEIVLLFFRLAYNSLLPWKRFNSRSQVDWWLTKNSIFWKLKMHWINYLSESDMQFSIWCSKMNDHEMFKHFDRFSLAQNE